MEAETEAHVAAAAEFKDVDDTPVAAVELRSWFAFGGAVDAISFAFSFFVPLIVEGIGAAAAVEASDHSVACDTTVSGYSCVIPINGAFVDPSSFYFYTVTLATFTQLVLFIGMGAIADHGAYRKSFMLGFSVVGAIACILFAAVVNPQWYIFSAVLAAIGFICLGATFVFIYAFLPPLARNHPDFVAVVQDPSSTHDDLLAKLDYITNRISSLAFVWMYGGSLVLLVVMVVLIFLVYVPAGFPDTYVYQIGVTIGGFGWLLGCGIAYKYLRERPGPPFPAGETVVFFSFKKVYLSLTKARKLSNLFTYLIAWFFYSDSLLTLVSVSVLWAQTQLGFTTKEVLILAAEVPILALFGARGWNLLQVYGKVSSKGIVLIQNSLYILIPLWGVVSFIPGVPFGYKYKIELFIGAALHGLLLGGTQSSCRSLFSQLLPAGEEAQFFSLYEITDKGSSWIGPLVVAAIQNSGANKAYTFVFLLAQFVVSLVLFSIVNVSKGIEQGKAFGAEDREIDAHAGKE